ncbi:DUF2232 domain-containing protein, partial [Dissulfurirhabdus thermomarina]
MPPRPAPRGLDAGLRLAAVAGVFLVPAVAPPLAGVLQLAGAGAAAAWLEGWRPAAAIRGVMAAVGAALLASALLLGGRGGLWILETGLLAGLLLRARHLAWSGPRALWTAVLVLAVSLAFFLALGSGGDAGQAWEALCGEVGRGLESSFGVLSNRPPPGLTPEEVQAEVAALRARTLHFLPGILFLSLFTVALANLFVARLLIHRWAGREVFGPAFRLWRFPEALVWPFIAAGLLSLYGRGGA